MVARSGRWTGGEWRLAPSLAAMVDEANMLAPRRSKASDGSIGDAAHRARTSQHNPDESGRVDWVDAIDLTHDPKGGWDAHRRARDVAARRDPRIRYIISAGEIWQPGIGWSGYGGENKHHGHAHFSVRADGRQDLSRWWPASWLTPPPFRGTAPPPRPSRRPRMARFMTDHSGLWWLVDDQLMGRRAITTPRAKDDIVTLSREQKALTGVPILVEEQVRVVDTSVLAAIPDVTPAGVR